MRCTYHPDIETNLRCGKCGKPICPKDMVQTPVGARCPDCAKLHKLPTFQVSTKHYLRSGGAGLGTAIACGAIWGVIDLVVPFFFLNLAIAAGIGFAIGEVTSRVVNRKRGAGLAAIAGVCVVISYLITILFPWGFPSGLFNIIYDLIAIAVGIFFAVTRLR